jgi:hypothetical protein
MVSATTSDQTARTGTFNYMAETSTPSLFRNGKVLTRRDRDGSDSGWEGVDRELRAMPVQDARILQDAPTLACNGFELRPNALGNLEVDFFDQDAVLRQYYPHCAEIVRDACGASLVAAFDHNVRSAVGKEGKQRIRGGQQVQGPAHMVHGDYTLTSAPQRLRDLARPPRLNDTLRSVLPDGEALLDPGNVNEALLDGRFAIINLWRSIAKEPVVTHPLALCDAATVQPDDLVVFEIHYHDRIGENYFAKHAVDHGWYFYPDLNRDEALLIKQWDSDGPLATSDGAKADAADTLAPCTFSFHSAFEDPATPANAAERWSIEVRCVALYD